MSVRDRTVLAFVDRTCVGTGKVGGLREDLARAGLGDGQCGFRFAVTLADPADASQLYLKLEGSDFVLPQRGSRIIDGGLVGLTTHIDRIDYSPESIIWMRDRHWLDPTDYDFLRHITDMGLYSRVLRTVGARWLDPAAESQRLFELYRQGPVRVQETVIQLRNLATERRRLVEGAAIPVIAIHAEAGAVRLLHGSRGKRHVADLEALRHICKADRLLLVDARTTFTGETNDTARVFRAV